MKLNLICRKKIVLAVILSILTLGCSNTETGKKENLQSNAAPLIIEPKEEIIVKLKYENRPPSTIPFIKKYDGKLADKAYYGIIMAEKANLREKPEAKSSLVKELKFYERVELLEEVEFKGQNWYKVMDSDGKIGYLFSPYITKRVFQFEKGLNRVQDVENFVRDAKEKGEELALVEAYTPDAENKLLSKKRDKYGKYKIQSASANYDGETLYIPDRSISKIVNDGATKKKVKIESMSEPYVEIAPQDIVKAERLKLKSINKAIVVDIENQNLILFEKIGGEWTIVSYGYSKTGYESTLGFETPRGSFVMDIAKDKMLYTGGDGKVQGFANNAMRFSGGGYLHGTPIGLEEASQLDYYTKFREGYLGTFSGTRKCVRTTKEHARFVYSWVLNKNPNGELPSYEVIKDNVLFIVY